MGFLGLVCLSIITIIFPPLTVVLIAGCGADLLLNVILTLLGFFPGHIHAFYLLYVYYHRRNLVKRGIPVGPDAVLVFSDRVQSGGEGYAYRRY